MSSKIHDRESVAHPVWGLDVGVDHGLPPASFAPQLTEKILSDAVRRQATRIRLSRTAGEVPSVPPQVEGWYDAKWESNFEAKIYLEIDGDYMLAAEPSVRIWVATVLRLKILAGMIDYGPHATTEGSFRIDSEATGDIVFCVTTNPNPYQDTEVMIEIIR